MALSREKAKRSRLEQPSPGSPAVLMMVLKVPAGSSTCLAAGPSGTVYRQSKLAVRMTSAPLAGRMSAKISAGCTGPSGEVKRQLCPTLMAMRHLFGVVIFHQ